MKEKEARLIHRIIGYQARREFATAMCFDEKENPQIPSVGADRSPRLLYMHIPFYEKLCPYCSFNRIVFDEDLCRLYFAALKREIRLYRDLGYDFGGIYVGGGTPTVMIEGAGYIAVWRMIAQSRSIAQAVALPIFVS